MSFSFLSVLFLFGGFQAVLFLFGIWRARPERSLSLCLLSIQLAGIALILVHHALYVSSPPDSVWRYGFIDVSAAAWMTVPPAFYFYIRSLVHSDFRWRRRYLAAFFLPLYYLLSWAGHLLGLEYGFYQLFAARPDWYLYGWIAGYLLYSVGWGAAALRVLYRDPRPERYRRQSSWLRWYTVGYLVAVGIAVEIFVYLVVTRGYSVDFEYGLLILFEVFVLTLVYQSLLRSTYSGWLADRLYGPSAITEDRLPQLRERLDAYVRDARPYLDPELRLATVAGAIGIAENELSQVFAHYPSGNFYGYVNGYRLRAFERALREGAADRLTIPGLARECGFKSKTSFYRLFREHYGTTPSNYLRELQSPTP